jgi:ribosomal-protein-alanine N-acetyltransferase
MVRIRNASAPDLPRIMALIKNAAGAAQWGPAALESLFMEENEARLVLVAEDAEGELAGFLVGRESAGDWEIENLAVSSTARRRGFGSRLLDEFMHHARGRNARDVFLEVRESNVAALALYEKSGFCQAGRRKQYYQDPCEDALILKFSFHPEMEFG